jgi:hypothetical protein
MEKEYLVIQGRVSNSIKEHFNLEKDNWFFVSYSPFAIPIGWLFHDEKGNTLELVNIHLQFNKSYVDKIPTGWKTICQFNIDIDIRETETWALGNVIDKHTIKIYPFTKAEMREKQIKSIIE